MLRLPKSLFLIVLFTVLFCTPVMQAQASFVLSSDFCVGDSIKVTANTGTLSASAFQWSSSPAGVVFSSVNQSVTTMSFPAPGNYTIQLAINSGTETSNASQPVTVHALPIITITPSKPFLCSGQDATLTANGALSYVWTPTVGLYFFSNSSAYISPITTVSYTLSGSDSFGCVGTTAYTMNVYNYPTLVIQPSPSSVCVGFVSTLTAFGANNFTWTSTNFSTGITQSTVTGGAGTYSLVGSNGGCLDSTTIEIGIAPSITVNITASRNTICVNDADSIIPIILTGTGAMNYTWKPYDPARMSYSLGTTTAISPSINTCYTLTGSTTNCADTEEFCVNVTTCTALYEVKKSISVVVFPNPVTEKLFVHFGDAADYTLKLFSITGDVLYEGIRSVSENIPQEIDLTLFPSGVYALHLSTNNLLSKTLRILKE